MFIVSVFLLSSVFGVPLFLFQISRGSAGTVQIALSQQGYCWGSVAAAGAVCLAPGLVASYKGEGRR